MGDFEGGVLVLLESTLKYHPRYIRILTGFHESGSRTVVVGQFDWGGLLRKSNGGAQWSFQSGWQSDVERKGIRWLDCETDMSNRNESWP